MIIESDEKLLLAVATGEHAAFERLYRRYEQRLLCYIRTFIADHMVAEEVLIDVMTAVWFGSNKYSGGSRASTWILGIARHKALDAGRRRAASRERVGCGFNFEKLGCECTQVDALFDTQCASQLSSAMDRLSREHREALRLAFIEELPYRDIASLLDVPVNTVKTRVFHAKQRLRDALQDSHLKRDRLESIATG